MVVRAVVNSIVRLISSAIGFLMPVFMMSSYLSPFGVAPVGNSFLPAAAMNSGSPLLNNATSSLISNSGVGGTISAMASAYSFNNPLDGILGQQLATSPIAQMLPFPIAMGSGFFVYMIISQVLGRIQTLTAPSSKTYPGMNPSSMGPYGTGYPNAGFQPSVTANKVPANLPADITKPQFMVLQATHQGLRKPKDIAQHLSLDKNETEREIAVLKGNGYLTHKGKLTSKAVELLSS